MNRPFSYVGVPTGPGGWVDASPTKQSQQVSKNTVRKKPRVHQRHQEHASGPTLLHPLTGIDWINTISRAIETETQFRVQKALCDPYVRRYAVRRSAKRRRIGQRASIASRISPREASDYRSKVDIAEVPPADLPTVSASPGYGVMVQNVPMEVPLEQIQVSPI